MVSILSLWIPILLSAVGVFLVSSILHMVFTYHRNDYLGVPDEGGLRAAWRGLSVPPGDYIVPYAPDQARRKSPEFLARVDEGPVVFMTVLPNGMPGMAGSLLQWFLYSVFVSFFAAYIAGHALAPGAHYLEVFRFVGAASFMGYSFALLQNSIWYRRKWSATIKSMFDGLVYSLVAAGCFGWLWPAA